MKGILLILLCFLVQPAVSQENWELKADSIVKNALEQIGVPYKWGTSSPDVSFDCSGFTSYIYNASNVVCSRSSRVYSGLGMAIPLGESRKGDCIIFSGTSPGSKTPGHVGIILSHTEEEIKFIHCSSSKKHFGVVVTDYYSSGYPKRYLQIRRLF
jgi:cell wall-associated NlpC family hydrolase